MKAALIWNPDVECLPLPQLVELVDRRLAENRLLERASRSPLYRERWEALGVRAEEVRSYAGLRRLPYTLGLHLREAQARYGPDELVCCDQVRLWVSTSGTTGSPKWIPVGDGDLDGFGEMAMRLMAMTQHKVDDLHFLFITAPAPFTSEPMAYELLMTQLLGDRSIELTAVSLPETFDALNHARSMQTDLLFSFPSLAMVIADGVSQRAHQEARQMLRKEHTLRNLLGVLVTRLVKIRARHVFRFRRAMLAGEPVDPYRAAIQQAFGLVPMAAYGASEFPCPIGAECSAADGLHIAIDYLLPELISQAELDREELEPGYVPQALPLWEAPRGMTGELVLTSFADALPLIRYRISDLAEVISTERCLCGRTYPRIKILHRSDDIVNLGLIRFSIYDLKRELAQVQAHGRVGNWQLHVTRDLHKPKAVLLVEPLGDVQPEAFIKEIKDRLDALEGVRQAWQNGMIAAPEVRLVERVEQVRTGSGKVKLAIYEPDYFAPN